MRQLIGPLLALWVAGCAPPPKPAPGPVAPPPATPTELQPQQPPPPPPQPEPPSPVRLDVDILVSADLPDYLAVAKQLSASIDGDVRTHYMKGNPATAPLILPRIRENEGDQVVGIGLLAARAAQQIPDRQAVFCQVFNYGDANLLAENSKGIALTPSPAFQLGVWKALQPNLTHVGLLIGPQQESLVTAARASAESLGIQLHVRVVSSDKGTLVALREMAADIDGLWLLPDNRILSTTTLRTLMSYSLRNGLSIAGFDHQLLAHGALLTVTPRHEDIAAAVIERLETSKGKTTIPGPGVVFLDSGDVRVNTRMAERMGLTIPQELRTSSDAP